MTDIDVLLVEDNSEEAELTIRALKKTVQAPTLVHVAGGQEALDFIFCQGAYEQRDICQLPKLILLDLKMPRVDGMEVLRKIKGDARTRGIPTVVLTSSKEDQDILSSYQLGANSYIVKPIDYDEFANAITLLSQYWLDLNHSPATIKK